MNPSENGELMKKWSENRWHNFHAFFKSVVTSNSFQSNRTPENCKFLKWGDFEDFLSAYPFTTKNELAQDRQKNPPYGTNLSYSLEEYKKFHQTSGTLGKPMTWLDTTEDWDWMLANWDRVLEEAGIEPGAKCFFAFSFGPFLGFWTAYEAAQRRGCLCMPTGGQGSEQRLRSMVEHGAEFLFCTPTYAMRLPEVAKQAGIDLSGHAVKKIIVAGEPGGSLPAFRKRVEESWGNDLTVYDHYGMTEVGPVAYESPSENYGLRIMLDSYFPEVIDPDTEKKVVDGKTGELVLTTLGRKGCPVFRYRTGDLVQASCGFDESGKPTFDLKGGILGRTDEMVVARGVNLYPSAVDAIVCQFSEVLEYQVRCEEKNAMLEVSMLVETTEDIASALEIALKEAFSLRIPVACVEANSLPRFEMKARRWIK
ncbi:MAG: hypothetical protein CMI27_05410 [Opitutae bacterium]|nr:hypothetical protein [Opitutae bacterium]|tara:strand:+ start:737 stop:2008 length:1272 start_codon:yes stop_codon:yes gene_type:complete